MASIITIDFTELPPVDATLRLLNPTFLGLDGLETFKTQRLAPFQTTVTDTGNSLADLNALAFQFAQSFQLDYNASGVFNIDVLGATVEIQCDQDNVFDGWNKTGSYNVNVTVSYIPSVQELNITGVTYSQADSDPCNMVKVRVQANKVFDILSLPIQVTNVNADFVDFDFNRGVNYDLLIIETETSQNDFQSSVFNKTPAILNESNILINESATPSGINLAIDYTGSLGENSLTYSLDGVTYQTSPVFSQLLGGTYTIFIKDLYGCEKSTTYTTSDYQAGQSSVPPYFYYPLSNPVSMAFNRDIDDCDNLNYDDLISISERNIVNHRFVQPFKPCDIFTIQFRTSNINTNVELRDCNGNLVVDGDFEQLTNNINNFDNRDAFKFTDDDLNVRIYFTSGNIYDENDQVTGSHSLNGNYPDGYKIGSYVKFDGTFELITDIQYNNEFERWEIVTSETSLVEIAPKAIIAFIWYNVQPYELYEVTFNLTGLDGFYQLYLESNRNDGNELIKGLSPIIEVSNDIDDNHIIEWGNSYNNDIIYSNGYRGYMRLIYDTLPSYVPTDEIEQYQTESNIIGLDSYNRNRYEFSFFKLSTRVVKQLCEILKNDAIFIDGKEYIKTGTPEVTRIGSSNAYNLKVEMQEQKLNQYIDEPYNSQSFSGGFAYSGGNLLSTGGFLIDSNGLASNG